MAKKNTEHKDLTGVKEIARRANVSIATVDRVIHNRTGVSANTREKISQIIEELNYQPNILARRLASKKLINIAVLIPEVSEETVFWEAPLRGIQRAESEIKQYGINITPYFFDLNDKHSFSRQAQRILASQVDGVLLSPSFIDEAIRFTEVYHARKIPFVFIDSNIPDQDSISYIGPPLYQSGYLGAHLLTYALKKKGKILVVTIAAETGNYNYLQIAEGFRNYFTGDPNEHQIIQTEIKTPNYDSLSHALARELVRHADIEAIFVTNSRVFKVARFLESQNRSDILLIGYDFLKENIDFLEKGIIDFLICHKPDEQGYRGIMALYQTLVMGSPVEKMTLMPIDIITKENFEFYSN